MSGMNDRNLLARLSHRAQSDPFFLGSAIREFVRQNDLDEAGLAGFLRCRPASLTRLYLCRQPVSHDASFAADVKRIAEFAGCSAEQLARLLREIAALRALQIGHEAGTRVTLLAARDRRKRPPGSKGKKQ